MALRPYSRLNLQRVPLVPQRASSRRVHSRLLHHPHDFRLRQNQIRVIFDPLFPLPLHRLGQYFLALWSQLLPEITELRQSWSLVYTLGLVS